MIMQASDCPLYETIVAEGRQATAEEIRDWLDTLFTHEEIGEWLTSTTFVEMVNHPSNHEKHGESNAPSGLWAHLGLMRMALELDPEIDELTPEEINSLEICTMMHDLCKKETAAPSKNKAWDDGTPQDTNYKHGPLAAKLFARWAQLTEHMEKSTILDSLQNRDWPTRANLPLGEWPDNPIGLRSRTEREIFFIIEKHMEMHEVVEAAKDGIENGNWPGKGTGRDFRTLPEELQNHIGDAESWDWPEFSELPINLQNVGWKKGDYNRCRMWNCRLLKIFQRCDAAGRFDDQRITS